MSERDINETCIMNAICLARAGGLIERSHSMVAGGMIMRPLYRLAIISTTLMQLM